MIKMIAAVSSNGVIGMSSSNSIPFHYPADLKHFKKLTTNSIVIMGRKTFDSIGKPLPNRRNIVISKIGKTLGVLNNKDIEVYSSLEAAINNIYEHNSTIVPDNVIIDTVLNNNDVNILNAPIYDIWLIGGASIYQEGLKYAKEIHLTITPDEINNKDAVRFPWIDPTIFELESWDYLDDEANLLKYCVYTKI